MKPDRRLLQTNDPFIADDLEQMESADNYNNWLFSLIRPYIHGSVLEVGPGIGIMSTRLLPFVDLIVGVEPNPYCVSRLSDKFKNNPKFILKQAPIETLSQKELGSYNFNTILCINVLEHIEDDRNVLKLFRNIIHPDGQILLIVPAVPAAYGPIDASIGHFRRYSRAMIKELIVETGLTVEAISHSNILGLLGWIFNSHILKFAKQSDRQIDLFDALVPFLSSIEKIIPPPIGMSLIAVCRRVK